MRYVMNKTAMRVVEPAVACPKEGCGVMMNRFDFVELFGESKVSEKEADYITRMQQEFQGGAPAPAPPRGIDLGGMDLEALEKSDPETAAAIRKMMEDEQATRAAALKIEEDEIRAMLEREVPRYTTVCALLLGDEVRHAHTRGVLHVYVCVCGCLPP